MYFTSRRAYCFFYNYLVKLRKNSPTILKSELVTVAITLLLVGGSLLGAAAGISYFAGAETVVSPDSTAVAPETKTTVSPKPVSAPFNPPAAGTGWYYAYYACGYAGTFVFSVGVFALCVWYYQKTGGNASDLPPPPIPEPPTDFGGTNTTTTWKPPKLPYTNQPRFLPDLPPVDVSNVALQTLLNQLSENMRIMHPDNFRTFSDIFGNKQMVAALITLSENCQDFTIYQAAKYFIEHQVTFRECFKLSPSEYQTLKAVWTIYLEGLKDAGNTVFK